MEPPAEAQQDDEPDVRSLLSNALDRHSRRIAARGRPWLDADADSYAEALAPIVAALAAASSQPPAVPDLGLPEHPAGTIDWDAIDAARRQHLGLPPAEAQQDDERERVVRLLAEHTAKYERDVKPYGTGWRLVGCQCDRFTGTKLDAHVADELLAALAARPSEAQQDDEPNCLCTHAQDRHLHLATSNRCADCTCDGYEPAAPRVAARPSADTETLRDDRNPKVCPKCKQWCVFDGWDHVHGDGLGIGSCGNRSSYPDVPVTKEETCD